jgi:hypothetical protein
MSKIARMSTFNYIIFCPACKSIHHIDTKKNPFHLSISSNFDTPTIQNMISIFTKDIDTMENKVCKFHIIEGEIVYHDDSTHELAGKSIKMEEI